LLEQKKNLLWNFDRDKGTWLIPNAVKQPHEIRLSKTPDWYLGKTRMGGVAAASH